MDAAVFSADLNTTLVPTRAGSSTPTFTRATTAYVQDWEGLWKPVLSGEARFTGARQVANLVNSTGVNRSTENFVGYSTYSAPTSVTSDTNDFPTGTSSSTVITNAAIYQGRIVNAAMVIGNTYRASIWAKGAVGGEVVMFTDNVGTGGSVAVTTSWRRYSLTFVTNSVDGAVIIAQAAVATVKFSGYLIESIVGQSNQNPSEYVSVGVLSAPYHGAGVDGVQYFKLLNGNTVASNVVTEATGALLTPSAGASTLTTDNGGPFGYQAEGARTNLALQSQTLATTWALSNALDMNAVTEDSYTAPDGTATMDKLSAKATNAPHNLKQAITFAASVHTFSCYLRYIATQRWAALILNDGTTTWGASFDLLNGVVGALAANTTSTITATNLAGVFRCTMTTAATLAAAGNIYISMNNTDTATLESWLAAGTELLGAWGAQLEAAIFASSYIPTTTVAVARNADVLTYPPSGNISSTEGTVYLEGSSINYAASPRLIEANGGGAPVIFGTTGQPRIYDGTTFASSGLANVTSGVIAKMAGIWTGSTMQAFASGVAGGSQAFDGSMGFTTQLSIGALAGGAETFGTIRNVRIYPTALSTAQLVAMTT